MQDENFLILPAVRGSVGKLASIAVTGLMLCAVAAVAETMFMSIATKYGLICGILSSFILNLELFILTLLAAWCHCVLLLERGFLFTRVLIGAVVFISAWCPCCQIYTLATGDSLLFNQASLPYIICLMLLFIHLVNLPNMNAASFSLKTRLGAFPILIIAIIICDKPGTMLPAVIGKLGLWILLAGPLQRLALLAPRVISMPEQSDSANE